MLASRAKSGFRESSGCTPLVGVTITKTRMSRLLAVWLFLPLFAFADNTSLWRLQFYGEAPCVGASGKQVYTVTSVGSITLPPGYSLADFFQDLVDVGIPKLPLVDNVGQTTFELTGCGNDPFHSTETATFGFIINPGGSGIFYVPSNYVNENFCGANTINVTVDPNNLTIQGNYLDSVGTTHCIVALAAPGAALPSVNPSQPPPPPPPPTCPRSAQPCPLQLNIPSPVKDAAEKKFYELIVTASGGTQPYTFSILPADPPFPLDFPKGLTYKEFGSQFVISGTPNGNYPYDYIFLGDTFSFRIQVTDHKGKSVTELTSIQVVPQLNIHPTWRPVLLNVATEGAPYYDFLYSAGGDDISYTKHWTLAGGALPPGIKMAVTSGSDLIFRGKPDPGSHGTYAFQVKVDDGFSYPDLQPVVINVFSARTKPLVVTTSTLPPATQGDQVNDQLAATGGSGVYTWTLTSAAPPGLTLSTQGVLSGPAKRGQDSAYTLAVHVKDSDGKTATGSIVMRINPPAGSALHFDSTAVLPKAYAGFAFTASVPALGGTPPYAISLDKSSSPLPAGLTLSPDGVLSGTPAKALSENLVLTVKDSKGKTSKVTLKLVVSGDKPPEIASLSPESKLVDSAAFNLQVKGNGFVAGAKILWNGEALPTQLASSQLLSALIPADLLTLAGAAQVSVENGAKVQLDPLPFAVLSTQPSTLIAPIAGTNLSDTVQFQWIRSNSTQYSLQLGDHGVGTNNLFNKTLASTASSVSASGLPLDGRTIYVRLGSNMHDGWHYKDYTFTTVRSATISRAQATSTLVFTNSLLYPVDITANGTVLGSVKASSTAQQKVTFTPPLMVSVEMERPATSSGTFLGDEFKGFYSPITNPAQTITFAIDNQLGTQEYFIPIFTNTTSEDRVLGVNMQLSAENRCNCVIPANSSNVSAGYYQLFTNSNVRLYNAATPYSGNYIYWGSPDGSSNNSLVPYVEAKTGRLLLTVR